VVAGERSFRLPLGTLICLAQGLSGAAVALVLAGPTLVTALTALVLFGAFSAPLTIWAQTLRMEIIPERMRGRTFALLRLLMQSGGPLGGSAAGLLLPGLGLPAMVALSALVIGLPGLLGYRLQALRAADQRTPAAAEEAAPVGAPAPDELS
jgi:MFS family permease